MGAVLVDFTCSPYSCCELDPQAAFSNSGLCESACDTCGRLQIARCNFYMFFSSVLYVNISGPMDFWFTADEACVPGGPAFDYTYYNSYTWVVGAITGWLGIVLFQATMSNWPFRRLFWVTTLLQVLASAFDLLIIARWNIAWGISDKARCRPCNTRQARGCAPASRCWCCSRRR
jgi:hypothetical protein